MRAGLLLDTNIRTKLKEWLDHSVRRMCEARTLHVSAALQTGVGLGRRRLRNVLIRLARHAKVLITLQCLFTDSVKPRLR
jgi:hypothetical protein